MKAIKTSFTFKNELLPLALVAMLAYGCSGSDHDGPVGTERMEETTSPAEKEEMRKREKSAIDQRRNHSPTMTTGAVDETSDRESTKAELEKLREQMTGELERVRTRLNDGTRTPELQKADQSLAASIAQQIERTDRTLDLVNNTSEEEWPNAQQRAKKELIELRSWVSHAIKPSR